MQHNAEVGLFTRPSRAEISTLADAPTQNKTKEFICKIDTEAGYSGLYQLNTIMECAENAIIA